MANVVSRDYIGRMRSIGIRDLKANLSQYLKEVVAGEEILVTDRGRAVAKLTPVSERDLDLYKGLGDLVSRGVVKPAVRENARELYPTYKRLFAPGVAARLLDEERDGP